MRLAIALIIVTFLCACSNEKELQEKAAEKKLAEEAYIEAVAANIELKELKEKAIKEISASNESIKKVDKMIPYFGCIEKYFDLHRELFTASNSIYAIPEKSRRAHEINIGKIFGKIEISIPNNINIHTETLLLRNENLEIISILRTAGDLASGWRITIESIDSAIPNREICPSQLQLSNLHRTITSIRDEQIALKVML